MYCSLPDSSICGIFQAKVLEWGAIAFSKFTLIHGPNISGSYAIDAFELWCWRRLLRVPWTARRSNQPILKINPGCSLEGMMLKLKLQYFGHLMQRVDSLEKTLMLGGIGGRRKRGRQRMRWLDGITDWLDGHEFEWTPGVGDGQGGLPCCSSWGHKELNMTEWLNWTELKAIILQQQQNNIIDNKNFDLLLYVTLG